RIRVARIEMLFVLAVVPRRLGEAVVEKPEATAGNVRHQAIEYLAATFVGVEAEVNKVAQKPAALGNAKAVGPADDGLAVGVQERILLTGVVAKVRNEIARDCVAQSLNDRVLALANQLVDEARPEPAGKPATNLLKRSGNALLDGRQRNSLELPLLARNRHALVGLAEPPRQDALGFSDLGGRVAAVAFAARKRQRLGRCVRDHLEAND